MKRKEDNSCLQILGSCVTRLIGCPHHDFILDYVIFEIPSGRLSARAPRVIKASFIQAVSTQLPPPAALSCSTLKSGKPTKNRQ